MVVMPSAGLSKALHRRGSGGCHNWNLYRSNSGHAYVGSPTLFNSVPSMWLVDLWTTEPVGGNKEDADMRALGGHGEACDDVGASDGQMQESNDALKARIAKMKQDMQA